MSWADVARAWEDSWSTGVAPLEPAATSAHRALEPRSARAWRSSARPVQLAVADTITPYTLFLAGRGAGKTWAASNAFAEWTVDEPGVYAVIAPTFSDCRQFCVEGPSGLLVALGDELASYDKSKFEIRTRSGSLILMASDEAPKRLRGPNFTGVWADEIGSWRNIEQSWDEGAEFATRIGSSRRLMTGTPKRGNRLIKEFHKRGTDGDPDVTLLRGSTMDNAANLSDVFLRTIKAKYEGTTLGRQELEGMLLADAEGAVVTTDLIDRTRVQFEDLPELERVIVGVDPAVTSRASSDHTGIVTIAIGGPPGRGYLGARSPVPGRHLYILADDSVRATPRDWAARVLKVSEMWAADAITPEVNQGGDLVTTMIRMVAASDGLALPRLIPVHAAVGKRTRAEPVAGVWEQLRIHVVGALPDLEDQFAGWTPGDADSPDQLDAAVWAAVGLMPDLAVKAATTVRLIA